MYFILYFICMKTVLIISISLLLVLYLIIRLFIYFISFLIFYLFLIFISLHFFFFFNLFFLFVLLIFSKKYSSVLFFFDSVCREQLFVFVLSATWCLSPPFLLSSYLLSLLLIFLLSFLACLLTFSFFFLLPSLFR